MIELLTVISIIGILTTVITVNLGSARKQARDVRRKTDLSTIQSALELFANANASRVPAATTAVTSAGAQPWIPDASNQLSTFVSNLPIDPIVSGGKNEAPFVYSYQTNPVCPATGAPANTMYALDAVLEVESPANVNLASPPASDPCTIGFYVTGTYVASDKLVHYRVSSGGR